MTQVSNSQPIKGEANTGKPTLQQLQADILKTRDDLEAEFRDSPVLSFAKQKLKEAATSITTELRNIRIEAEQEAHDLEQKAKKAL